MMLPWTAAPYATASSGLIRLLSSLPSNNSVRSSGTLGILVLPPLSPISSMSVFLSLASAMAFLTGPSVFLKRSEAPPVESSNAAVRAAGHVSAG
ncbi:hypothetical protein PVAP13_4NG227411 [Panicum virgatum]|uniref:Uncharacterized protein n=1 Tax=Panicum virgatum TaxID=38727 RepID=A0A8T0TE77_PANVG|nr:hypothetical protein PVAP13_4NG227411 [Panicum virgatum]